MKLETRKVNLLPVHIYETREEMGIDAAADAAARINRIIAEKGDD